jgi:hypothetical protein
VRTDSVNPGSSLARTRMVAVSTVPAVSTT